MEEHSGEVSPEYRERISDEVYIVSRQDDRHNTKLRKNRFDIKALVGIKLGLEQWCPVTEPVAVLRTMDLVGLAGLENVNDPRAIKRIIGWST